MFTKMTSIILCLLALVSIAGAEDNQRLSEPATRDHDEFQYDRRTPVEFLNFLRDYRDTSYTSWGASSGWIGEADLPLLIEKLDSTEPCANVMSAYSSYIDKQPSFIGRESAYLIEEFRRGKYPPGLNSTKWRFDPKEIRAWYVNEHNNPRDLGRGAE